MRSPLFRRLLALATLSCILTGEVAADPDADEDEGNGWQLSLDAVEEYRFRLATQPEVDTVDALSGATTPSADHDLRLFLGGQIASPEDHFAADVAAGLWWDINGEAPSHGQSAALGSIYDASSPPVWIDVYSLNGEYRDFGLLSLARVGRQDAEHGRPVVFDGGTIRIRPLDPHLELFAFGGRTHHFFEVDSRLFEDWLGSAGAVLRPLPGLRVEVDYRLLKEDTTTRERQIEHSYGAAGWYRHDDWLHLKLYGRGLDERFSRIGGASSLEWIAAELGLDLGADAQLITLGETGELDDPFFSILGESLPHLLLRADLWKAFSTDAGTYTLHGGWNGRILTADDPTRFNRDYGRVYLWLQAVDILFQGPFASLMGEYHYTHRATGLSEDGFFTVGGSAGLDFSPVRLEAGSSFARYKYDYYMDVEEKADVRTYFGEIGFQPIRWFRVRARYEYEQFDRSIHTAMLTLSQTY